MKEFTVHYYIEMSIDEIPVARSVEESTSSIAMPPPPDTAAPPPPPPTVVCVDWK